MSPVPPGLRPSDAVRGGDACAAGSDGAIGTLVDRYGWRLFVMPVLATLTIVALFRPGGARPGG